MSLESAGEFVLDFLSDPESQTRADTAYLDALSSIATEGGYQASPDEIRDAMRAMAGLDEESEVDAYGVNLKPTGAGLSFGNSAAGANSVTVAINANLNTAFDEPHTFSTHFSPLGFLR